MFPLIFARNVPNIAGGYNSTESRYHNIYSLVYFLNVFLEWIFRSYLIVFFGILRVRFVNYTICQLLLYFSIKLINDIYLKNKVWFFLNKVCLYFLNEVCFLLSSNLNKILLQTMFQELKFYK